MTIFYTLLTTVGAAEWAAAEANTIENVPITHLAVGDGNGDPVVPSAIATELVNEVHRVAISSIIEDPDHPTWLIVEAVIPTDVGGWTVREIGLIGGSGAGDKLLAMGNFPATDKPLPVDGAARDLAIRMVIQVSNTAVVELSVDPSVTLATLESIDNAIAAHEAALDPHPQYLTEPEGIAIAAAAVAEHDAEANPHPQYLTSSISYFMGQL
ncbi:MAG: phage tail protein [Sterolibacterium sp.]|nr:phage tail protein [Sterolibacterium sp.]